MKKIRKIFAAAFLLAPLVLFTGCPWFSTGTTADITYDPDAPFTKLKNTDTTVNLSNVKGKYITYMVLNTGDGIIYQTRYVPSANMARSIADYEEEGKEYFLADEDASKNTVGAGVATEDAETDEVVPHISHFSDPGREYGRDFKKRTGRSARSALDNATERVRANTTSQFSDTNFTVNTTTATLYALTDADLEDYTKTINCTLRATAGSGSNKVYVWVHDDCWISSYTSSTGIIVNKTIAEAIADKFEKFKAKETTLLGAESDNLLYTKNGDDILEKSMASNSSTGTAVNIVIYDIGSDYSASDYSNGGVVGFFTSKDYYEKDVADYVSKQSTKEYFTASNEGKYFYIDAAWCNYYSSAKTKSDLWKGTGTVSDTVISTLFHEFQHMINFGNKKGYSSAWFDEMMSMLTEDVMQPIIGYDEDEAPAPTRLPVFNWYYQCSGADTWLDGNDMIYSYSSAYSFGAYLTRNYGGAELISEMSKNEYADWNAVTQAIWKIKKQNREPEDLVTEWALACCYPPSVAKEKNLPTFYKTTSNYSLDEYTYSLSPINIFSYEAKGATNKVYGPAIFKSSSASLTPHGFLHFAVGQARDNEVTIKLDKESTNSDEVVYILVHDSLDPTKPDVVY